MQDTPLVTFGSYWHDSFTQLLQICWLHIHNANLLFHCIPKVLYWMDIWWLQRQYEGSELIVMFKNHFWLCHYQPELRMEPCSRVSYAKTLPTELNKWRLISPGDIFYSPIVHFWWTCANSSLFPVPSRQTSHLAWSSAASSVHRDALLHTAVIWVTVAFISS